MVILRPFESKDADRVQKLLNDEDVSRYLTSRVSYPYTIEQAEWWVTTGSHQHPTWAIVYCGELVGCIGVEPGQFDEAHSAEVGYWVGKDYWGKGIASAALMQVTDAMFSKGKYMRLYAGVYHPNEASMHVLKKCGYVLEGVLHKAYCKNGRFYDKHLFARVHS